MILGENTIANIYYTILDFFLQFKKNMTKFRFSIDRGGTFTDVYAECPDGEVEVLKLLSEDPAYSYAPTEAIRRILQKVKKSFLYTL